MKFARILAILLLCAPIPGSLFSQDATLPPPSVSDPDGISPAAGAPFYLRRNQQIVSPRTQVFDTLYNGRSRRNPVETKLIEQGYDVAGKLPILPAKPDAHIRDAAGNVLPSLYPQRYQFGPILGNARTTRDPLQRNRLSPTERVEQQLYRGPSHPGMIAPRAQQERQFPSARDLGPTLRGK